MKKYWWGFPLVFSVLMVGETLFAQELDTLTYIPLELWDEVTLPPGPAEDPYLHATKFREPESGSFILKQILFYGLDEQEVKFWVVQYDTLSPTLLWMWQGLIQEGVNSLTVPERFCQ